MNKVISLFFLIFLSVGVSYSQTEQETLEWLRTKSDAIQYIESNSIEFGELEMTGEQLKLSDIYKADDPPVQEYWNNIRDIKPGKNKDSQIRIIFTATDKEKKPIFILLWFKTEDKELTPKYLKALHHMATLKGAKLVAEDLFQ